MMQLQTIKVEVDTTESGPSVKVNDTEVYPLMKAVDDFAETITNEPSAIVMFAALSYRLASGAAAEDMRIGGQSVRDMVIDMFTQSYDGFIAAQTGSPEHGRRH